MKIGKLLIFIFVFFCLSVMATQNFCFAGLQSIAKSDWEQCNEQPCWVIQERNLRCVGGYIGEKGRTVLPKLLFRSARLDELTEEELTTLTQDMKLKTVVDFRSTAEIIDKPEETVLTNKVTYYSLPMSTDAILENQPNGAKLLDYINGKISADQIGDAALAAGNFYPDIVTTFADKFKQFFSLLADPDSLPLLYHCTAGKDRTGIATALTLQLLGVSDEMIMADYIASWDFSQYHIVFPEWLQPLLDAVEDEGGIEPYLMNVIGVDAATLLKIRKNFTPDDTVLLWRGSSWYYNSLGKFNFSDEFRASAGIEDESWKKPLYNPNNKAWNYRHDKGFAPFGLMTPTDQANYKAPYQRSTFSDLIDKYAYATPLPYDDFVSSDMEGFEDSSQFVIDAINSEKETNEYIETEFGPMGKVDLDGKFITYYFRQNISLPQISPDEGIMVNVSADDGFILYFNDHEVLRWNMPEGATDHFTLATRSVDPVWKSFNLLSSQYLQPGENLIAVEVHQSASDSSDMAFDLELSRINYKPANLEIITDSSAQVLSNIYVEARQNGTTQNYIDMDENSTMSLIPGIYDIVVHAEGYASTTYNALSLSEGQSVALGITFHEEQKIILSGDNWQYWPSIPLEIDLSASNIEKLGNLKWLSDPSSITGWSSIQTPLSESVIPAYQFSFYDTDGVPRTELSFGSVGNVLRLYKNFIFDSDQYNQLPFIKFRFRTDSGDGLFVYLNGEEYTRFNIDEGVNSSDITVGSRVKLGEGPSGWQEVVINPSSLNRLSNRIAVDIRQPGGSMSIIDEKIIADTAWSFIKKEGEQPTRFLMNINHNVVEVDPSSDPSITPGGWQDVIALSSDLFFDAELIIPSYFAVYPYNNNDEVEMVITLTDTAGEHVSDASIMLNNTAVEAAYADGEYRFSLFPGEYGLTVEHSDYVSYTGDILLTSSAVKEKKLNITLYGNEIKPPYGGEKFEEPQVLMGGFAPSLAKAGDIITTWALVRQGRAQLSSVMLNTENSSLPLRKNGTLINGDELWTASFRASEELLGSGAPLLSMENFTLSARDSSGLTSPLFPQLGHSDFGPLDFAEDFHYNGVAPEFYLDNTQTSSPQLTGCGCVPAFLEDKAKVELIAVVRKGDDPLDYVLWQDPSSAFELAAEHIGELPNGDLIYSVELDADSLKTDLLSSGKTFRAFDTEGRESNACFEIKSVK